MKRIFNECLQEYCSRDYYPWHMPGHKRQEVLSSGIEVTEEPAELKEPEKSEMSTEGIGNTTLGVGLDVTEVPGLDNLLAPEGTIAESMAQLPEIYGSRKSYYLVNGSTGGILTAVSAVCNSGDTIIMSRNCHKSVYNIVALLNLKPVYLYPRILEPYGICGSITPAQVEKALQENPEAKAVIFPSPTYEGILSDVRRISEIVHRAGKRLIVDEAHGAHLEFGTAFPDSAVRCGADLVIESLHKTLPCYTQCAILHVGNKDLPDSDMDELTERIEYYLSVHQTSSPSYLFVAAMEDCIATMDEWRQNRMAEYTSRLKYYRKKWMGLKWIHLLTTEEVRRAGVFAYDESKLIFCMPEHTWTGEEFRKEMEDEFGMVPELASLNYILAMTGVADTEGGFERLHLALQEMDKRASQYRVLKKTGGGAQVNRYKTNAELRVDRASSIDLKSLVVLPGEALHKKSKRIPLEEAVGQIAGAYVTVYPPGIPVLVPGERISEAQRAYIAECIRIGLKVHGIRQDSSGQDGNLPYIKVLQEEADV